MLASKSAGTRVRSTDAYSAKEGATESSAKLTGSPEGVGIRSQGYGVRGEGFMLRAQCVV